MRDPRELFGMEETMRTLRPEKQRRRSKIALFLITLCAAALLSYAALTGTLAAPKQLAGARTQLLAAAASAPSFLDWAVGAVYRTFCPYVSDCEVEYAALNSQQQPAPTPAKPQPLPAQNSPDGSARSQASSTQPIVYQTVNQPVIERVIERQRVVTEDGVSETTLADRLNQLENKLRALIFSQSSQQSAQTSAVYNAVALSQRVDKLSGTNISNPTITGGSITGSSITGTISNAIATALATIDDLTSTTITATNATFTNSTTTNATTTNLYATSLTAGNATTTSLAVLGAATASFGGGISAAAISASATSTFSGLVLGSGQLRLSSLDCTSYANGGTLTTDASGNVVCAADDGGAGSTVAGADTQIQFNNGGSFGAAANFTFASSTGKLAVPYASSTALTTGAQWFTSLSNSGLGVDANGKVYAAATSTLATISGQLNLSQIANQAANTVLVNNTAGAAAPTALSTSTFAATLYSGTAGQTLAYLNGAWVGAATTTLTNGTGITTTYNAASNQWTVTNTSLSIGDPFTHSTTFATTTSATTTSLHTAGVFFASSTAAASQFPFASTTAISATTLCLTSDCRTSWPTGGGIGEPFTHQSYAAQTTSATSSTLWLTNPTLSLVASSTFATFASSTNASTTQQTIATLWLPPLGIPAGSFIAVDASGQVIATATPAVGGGGTVTNVSGANGIQGSVSSNGSLSLVSYLATSSSEVAGNLSYWTTTAGNPAQLGTVATTSLGFSGPFTGFASLGALVGGSNSTINWTGLSTTSQPASSNLLVSDGVSGVYGVGTSSLGVTGPITFSGTLGAQIGGAAGSFGCTNAASGITGCLTGTDWDTFNNKQAAGNYITALTGDVIASGPGSASVSFAVGNTHWWTAQQNFGNASTSQFTATSSVWFTSLGTPAGTFLAVDPNGLVIATSTPAVGGSGTVTNIATTYPITGGPITTTGTLSLAFGTTTTNTWAHQIFSSLFATNASTTNATTTNLHITSLTNSGLGVDANGKVYAAATSTLADITGTLALSKLANQNANTVLANGTAGSAAPTAIATSSFFGTGAGGQVLAWNGGVPSWVATTTLTNGAGLTTTYSAATNQWNITNTGATFAFPFTTSSTFGTTSSATSSSIQTAGVFFASSTAAASQFPYASSTALSAGTLCIAADCRTAWPTGGGGDPFPVHTSYAGLTTSGTSSTLWLTGSTISLAASSSVLTFASSTAFTVSGASYFNGGFLSLASSTIGNGTQTGGLTISGGATTTGNAFFVGNVGIGTTSPATLSIQAAVNATPLNIASSSGASMLSLDTTGALTAKLKQLTADYAVSSTSQSISAGDIVALVNGEAQKASADIGSPVALNSVASTYESAAALDSTHFVVAYRGTSNYAEAVVCSVSDLVISCGSPTALNSAASSYISAAALDSTHFVVAYTVVTNYVWAVVSTVSGTTITPGTPTILNGVASSYISAAALDSTHFVVAYRGTTNYPWAVVSSVSGTTITPGTAADLAPGVAALFTSAAALDSTHFVVAFESSANKGYATAASVSGTTITPGSATTLTTDATDNDSIAALDSTHFVTAYHDTNNYLKALVSSVSGTTITPGTVVQLANSVTLHTGTAALDSSTFVVAYKDGTGYTSATVASVSGTTIDSTSTPAVLNSVASDYASVVALDSTTFVVAHQNTGTTYANAIAARGVGATISGQGILGMATGMATPGGTVTVASNGIVSGLSGLYTGAVYYFNQIGGLSTTTTGTYKVGLAVSSSSILLNSGAGAGSDQFFGDMIFANNFRITEGWQYPNSLIWKNQLGREIMRIDETGALSLPGILRPVTAAFFNDLSATTSVDELTASSTSDASASWRGSFASAGAALKDVLATLGSRIIRVFVEPIYAAVGIFDEVLAKFIHADRVETGELCVGSTCITESQLAAVLQAAGQSTAPASTHGGAPSSAAIPASTEVPSFETASSTAATSSPPIAPTTAPASTHGGAPSSAAIPASTEVPSFETASSTAATSSPPIAPIAPIVDDSSSDAPEALDTEDPVVPRAPVHTPDAAAQE